MSHDVYFFGCWGRPGHDLSGPHGAGVEWDERRAVEYYDDRSRHIDGTLAPRRHRRTGEIVWAGMAPRSLDVERDSDELPQGRFLRHELDTGLTAIAWWDRTQGDARAACNAALLARGRRTSAEMLALLAEHFPTVLANLARAGVALTEVQVEATGGRVGLVEKKGGA